MGGFTRILHSGKPDDWMHEIPTVIVNPLPDDLEKIADVCAFVCFNTWYTILIVVYTTKINMQGYVKLNRPHAILQWVKEYMPRIKEHFVLLAEPDHLLIRAPPLWATYSRPSAYPFFYIKPSEEKNAKIIQKYNPKDVPLKQFFPVGAFGAMYPLYFLSSRMMIGSKSCIYYHVRVYAGPSPLMISKKQLGPISSKWFNISFALKQDKEAFEAWGWTSEMCVHFSLIAFEQS